MPAPSRSQAIGISAVLVLITGIVLVSVLRTGATSSAPGITLKDAFPQAPAAPPPVRPTDPVANLPRPSDPSASTTAVSNPPPTTDSGNDTASPVSDSSVNIPSRMAAPDSTPVPTPSQIAVDVAGAVRKPGLYYLPANARNNDAIKAAGGATDKANLTAINLASRLADGKQLYVPTRKERPQNGAADNGTDAPETVNADAAGTPLPGASASVAASKPAHAASKVAAKKGGKSASGKFHAPGEGTVNLNVDSVEQLQRLPGVGPAMADRLVQFRKENHGFQTVEDLMHKKSAHSSKRNGVLAIHPDSVFRFLASLS